MQPFFIDVIIPLALRTPFTYRVPDDMLEEIIPGKRVVVPFGPKRLYTALVYKIDTQPTKGHQPKEVHYLLDDEPIITGQQFQFWEWIAEYYMCGLGSVMLTALPSAMRLSSQTNVISTDSEVELERLSELDRMVLANLPNDKLTRVDTLESLATKSQIQRSLDALLRVGLVAVDESIQDTVKPKEKTCYTISDNLQSDDAIATMLDSLSNAPKQLAVMMKMLELSRYFDGAFELVERKRLLNQANASGAIIQSLLQKAILKEVKVVEDMNEHTESSDLYSLTDDQSKAMKALEDTWEMNNTTLLHGITGSGKTLLYAQAINKVVKAGGQVLLLVPEIALTTQLVGRLKTMIDAELMIYHSRHSNKERLTMWIQALGEQHPQVIIGARSAIFLPFKNLKLIVVDEEHDSSYKQSEGSPNYNARDAALWLARKNEAKVVLGSATPSVKSYHYAKTGRFGLVDLKTRYADQKLPEIAVSDLRKALKDRTMKADFTEECFQQISKTLQAKKQVIIFQNRRGYAPFQLCQSCGWSAECINCDVNLTYHRFFEKLLCHYCGHSIKLPTHCPQCGSAKLVVKGMGTEKIEDDLELLFPDARIARMDADTTRKKQALQNLITAFEEGSYDVLVGTQMVTKGLDFDNVGLVVVMNADSLWSRPNYQAFERAFQLLTQVAGRAGRKHDRGKVIIQTYRPEHPVLKSVLHNNYVSMYEAQVMEREQYKYPPFSKLVKIQISHRDAKFTKKAADYMAMELRKEFGSRLLGPEEPPIARIRNRYLRHIYLKLETSVSAKKARSILWHGVDLMDGHKEFKKARIQIDVDPE
ncbi:MAG: primosomal protein N' [Salibacteraceae bacterium]